LSSTRKFQPAIVVCKGFIEIGYDGVDFGAAFASYAPRKVYEIVWRRSASSKDRSQLGGPAADSLSIAIVLDSSQLR
jgi:hypothetical protein